MQISEMNQAELSIFMSQLKLLEIEVVSTEDLRKAITEGRKALDEMKKQQEKEIQQKLVFLNEQEKLISKLEKGSYR